MGLKAIPCVGRILTEFTSKRVFNYLSAYYSNLHLRKIAWIELHLNLKLCVCKHNHFINNFKILKVKKLLMFFFQSS